MILGPSLNHPFLCGFHEQYLIRLQCLLCLPEISNDAHEGGPVHCIATSRCHAATLESWEICSCGVLVPRIARRRSLVPSAATASRRIGRTTTAPFKVSATANQAPWMHGLLSCSSLTWVGFCKSHTASVHVVFSGLSLNFSCSGSLSDQEMGILWQHLFAPSLHDAESKCHVCSLWLR